MKTPRLEGSGRGVCLVANRDGRGLMRDFRTVCNGLFARAREGGMLYRKSPGLRRYGVAKMQGSGMTGDELRKARVKLGELWELGRSANAAELGRALRLCKEDPGQTIRAYEAKRDKPVPGPVSVAVELLLTGMRPPDGLYGSVVLNRKRS